MDEKFDHERLNGMTPRVCSLLTPRLIEWGGASGDNFSDELQEFASRIIEECASLTLDYKNEDHYSGWIEYREEIRRKLLGVE